MYASEYPMCWEKKVRVLNLLALAKKGSVSWTVRTYVFHLLRTYVMILCNCLIL